MSLDLNKLIEKELQKYSIKNIKILNTSYNIHIFSEEEDLNLFEGFLFAEVTQGSEFKFFKNKYKAPVSGYVVRLSLILYEKQLLVKDYRRDTYVLKSIKKVNKPFINKIKRMLANPKEENFNKLFDRTDIIEEFYILFKKTRQYIQNNIKGISDEARRYEYIDNLMMQMLTLWYLQEKSFFNNDNTYFISKFLELKQKRVVNNFNNYYEFLIYFFNYISGSTDNQENEIDPIIGNVVIIGPAIFINGNINSRAISIPDKCFYNKDITKILINTEPKKVPNEIPLLNLFESRDWTEGNIDEYVIGSLYEKLITEDKKKRTGAYYTPEDITSYICRNTIEYYFINIINEEFNENYEEINEIIEKADKDLIIYVFNKLKGIKILDPAVGSAHFLESAINVLVEIYKKLSKKAKEFQLYEECKIIITNKKGKLLEKSLLEISNEEQFKLFIKFFIILSKNIYGVDINPTAINVAKARLFLNIAKHFDIKKGYIIRFPNVHFNLRVGNSLIGYINAQNEIRKKHVTLDYYINKEEFVYVKKRIKIVSEIKEYLIDISKSLNIKSNIIEEIHELNKFLSIEERDWSDFNKILKIKENLIKILIISLNSNYALPLNDLINKITELFNNSLNEKLASDYKIKLKQLLEVKTFFWNFEFPEVFMDNHGFDIIIGNPPYGNILTELEKCILEKESLITTFITEKNGLKGTKNAASIFIEKSYYLLNENGYLGMILPKSMLYIEKWKKLRNFLLTKVDLKRVVDNSKAFKGVKLEMCTIIYKISRNIENRVITHNLYIDNLIDYSTEPTEISKSYLTNKKFITEFDGEKLTIYKYILSQTQKLGDGIATNFRGLNLNKFVKDEPFENSIKILRGRDIQRFNIRSFGYIEKNKITKIEKSSIIVQRIVAHIGNPKPHIKIIATLNDSKYYTVNTLTNITIKSNKILDKYLLIILNSNLISWYMYKYIYVNAIRSMDLVGGYCDEVPIKLIPLDQQELFENIANYLLFLNHSYLAKFGNEIKDLNRFFMQLADYLIYETYFKPKLNSKLMVSINKSFEIINYNSLIENKNDKGIKDILLVIKKCYDSLINSPAVENEMRSIENFNWIKLIEGS